MKNQYVGDVNDYRKYGLLRLLSGHGKLRTAVCWMLTDGDGRRDGGKTKYLDQPKKYQAHDRDLFASLKRLVQEEHARDVGAVERAGILPRARFHSPLLVDDPEERRRYMGDFSRSAAGCDLAFFDPDNGLEVKSTPLGLRGSGKYLYWDEVTRAFGAGHSVLIYQHFPRRERGAYTAERVAELRERTGAEVVHALKTPNVLFLLAAQKRHVNHFQRAVEKASATWKRQIEIVPVAEPLRQVPSVQPAK